MSLLYDAFELVSLYRVLDSDLVALSFPVRGRGGRAALDTDVVVAAANIRTTARRARSWRKRTVVMAARRTGKVVLHSICRTFTCSRKTFLISPDTTFSCGCGFYSPAQQIHLGDSFSSCRRRGWDSHGRRAYGGISFFLCSDDVRGEPETWGGDGDSGGRWQRGGGGETTKRWIIGPRFMWGPLEKIFGRPLK
jgi:hypothetical protein